MDGLVRSPGSSEQVLDRGGLPRNRMRVLSVDALRGLVMIIMALDHVREYFHSGAMAFQPEDLTRTTAALFFTRWITHFCAPVFAFTAGVGAFLWHTRTGRDVRHLSRFLWKRGAWLILLELVVVRFAMFFSLASGPVILSVLWALGWGMILLGFAVRLPLRVLAGCSVALIVGHNLADSLPAEAFGPAAWLWNIVRQPGIFRWDGVMVLAAYPLVPWVAVMAAGFCFGHVTQMENTRRRLFLFRFGLALSLTFVMLRLLNSYGDPRPWSVQATPIFTVLSFLNTAKYPPSLDFLLMTLGPALILWGWFEQVAFTRSNPLIVFGRVPLFYFIVHLYLIHGLTYAFAFGRYGTTAFLSSPPPSLGGSPEVYPPGYGYDLAVVYLVWLGVVGLMYPLCRFVARLKERRKDWWLSYI